MINCLIIDDEPLAREGLKSYVDEVVFLQLIACCESPIESMRYLAQRKIDLIFLDIQMPRMNGIDFLKSLTSPPMTIITTAYPSYALEGYQLDVIDYLVKPIIFQRFLKSVNKAQDYHLLLQAEIPTQTIDYFFVKCGHKYEKIRLADILFIEGSQNYITIYTPHGKYLTLLSMKAIQEELPAKDFVRVHKSYIVALKQVDAIRSNEIRIRDNIIPLSRSYREEATKQVLNNRFIGK